MHLVQARPGAFPPEVRAATTAVVCRLPQVQAVPVARWSWTERARPIAALPGLPRISASPIGRWLRAERIRPWR